SMEEEIEEAYDLVEEAEKTGDTSLLKKAKELLDKVAEEATKSGNPILLIRVIIILIKIVRNSGDPSVAALARELLEKLEEIAEKEGNRFIEAMGEALRTQIERAL
uniref:PD-L1 binder n=1 Tax=synthetic construct TaxID=32630 RepID=UPI003526C3E8